MKYLFLLAFLVSFNTQAKVSIKTVCQGGIAYYKVNINGLMIYKKRFHNNLPLKCK